MSPYAHKIAAACLLLAFAHSCEAQTFDSPSLDPNGLFGGAIAIEGNNVLVGASNSDAFGQVFLFDADNGSLLRTFDNPTKNDVLPTNSFGGAVAMSGNNIAISARDYFVSGPDYTYLFDLPTGNLLQTFTTGGGQYDQNVDTIAIRAFHDCLYGYPQWANQPTASCMVTFL